MKSLASISQVVIHFYLSHLQAKMPFSSFQCSNIAIVNKIVQLFVGFLPIFLAVQNFMMQPLLALLSPPGLIIFFSGPFDGGLIERGEGGGELTSNCIIS